MVFVAVSERTHAAVIETPGAWMSTHWPWFEKLAKPSLMSVAPTVMALGADAGEYSHASLLELPAATTVSTLLSKARWITSS